MALNDRMSSVLKTLTANINLTRLAIVLAAVAVTFGVLVFVVGDSQDGSVESADLLQAPPTADGVTEVGLESGQLAPDFEISTPDGDRVRLSDLRGRPVLINFWAAWCVSCLSEMPDIKALQEERGLDTFSVLAVNAGESRERALEFIEFLDAPFIYGLDVGLSVADAYAVYGLPLTVFIDSNGIVRAVYRGHADSERLNAMADAAISAQPPVEFAPALRFISPIPRERVVTVSLEGDDRLILSSRSLRCDTNYCADSIVETVVAIEGVLRAEIDHSAEEPELKLDIVSEPEADVRIAQAVAKIIESLEDPLYPALYPVSVEYSDGS